MSMYNGQAEQDKFVCSVLNNKMSGCFVEVGSNHPIEINNTYKLEHELSWTGLMLEYQQNRFEQLYKMHRPNSIYVFGDAQQHDYLDLFESNKLPINIDYLQLDIEPARKTFNVLKALDSSVMDLYKFRIITFEHDYCHDRNDEVRLESRRILLDRGYDLVFPDIHNKLPKYVYEDWYVHPELVNMEYINNLKSNNQDNYITNQFLEIERSLDWRDIVY